MRGQHLGAVLITLFATTLLHAQSIITVAGGAVIDGRPATVSIVRPYAVAVNDNGDIFVAEGSRRVRRISAKSGLITAFAGTGGTGATGDGGPATQATLGLIGGLALDRGRLYISDTDNRCIRSVDLQSGVISTVVTTELSITWGLAVDSAGRLYFSSGFMEIDRADPATGQVTTIAQNIYITSMAIDQNDQLYVAEVNPSRAIVRVDAGGGLTTIADAIDYPTSMAFDRSGNLFFAETTARVRFIDRDHVIHPFIDKSALGPAFAPDAVAVEPGGGVLIGDAFDGHLYRVSGTPVQVATIAGNGLGNAIGDGGPATVSVVTLQVPFISPNGHFDAESATGAVAVSPAADVYIGDRFNAALRRIDGASGTIQTVLSNVLPRALSFGPDGALFFLDGCGIFETRCLIQRFDPSSGKAAVIAGNGTTLKATGLAVDSSGRIVYSDHNGGRINRIGPGGVTTVVADHLCQPTGITTESGRIYFAACAGIFRIDENGTVTQVSTVTADRFLIGGTYAGLRKQGSLYVAGPDCSCIYRIDDAGTATIIAGGRSGLAGDGGAAVDAALASPNSIDVTSNGDLFIGDTANDRIRAVPACAPLNPFNTRSPASGESSVSTSPLLSWERIRPRTGTPRFLSDATIRYDVYLDVVNPPVQVVARNITAPLYGPSNLQPMTTYYWKIVAKGDPFCSPTTSTSTTVTSFKTTSTCAPPAVSASQSAGTITIDDSPAARSYDLYAGPNTPPPLIASGIGAGQTVLPGLAAGTTYYWRVAAHASCDQALTNATAVRSFVTPGSCVNAAPPALLLPGDGDNSVPSSAMLAWSRANGAASYDVWLDESLYASGLSVTSVLVPGLNGGSSHTWRVVAKSACGASNAVSSEVRRFTVARCATPPAPQTVNASRATAGGTYALRWSGTGDSYLVERASDPQFTKIVDRQRTRLNGVTFIAGEAGAYYHRVRTVAACGAESPFSDVVPVSAAIGSPVVIFTVLPRSLITRLGEPLETQKRNFTLENLSNAPVVVFVAREASATFFTVVDLAGGEPSSVTLEPHRPHDFEIRFSAPNTVNGFYEARIFVLPLGAPLRFTPQSYVSLRVGGDPNAPAPKLLVDGLESGILQFPPVSGSDDGRPPAIVDLLNDGTRPLQAAAELSPDAWLKLDNHWSSDAVLPKATRSIQLSTERSRAVAGSSLPRYTHLTMRNLAGQSARLLVEDDGVMTTSQGRSAPLAPGERSIVLPHVDSGSSIFLTNTGGDPAPVDLIDSADQQTSLVIPADDVVRLRGKVAGRLEIVSPRLDQLVVRADGAGAISGALTGGDSVTPLFADGLEHGTSLIVTETAGRTATVTVRLYEPGPRTAAMAQKTFTVAANSELRIDNLFAEMDLESGPDDRDQRNKDEIDVLAVLTATGGVVSARAVLINPIEFVPAGGGGTITTAPPARRRPVGR